MRARSWLKKLVPDRANVLVMSSFDFSEAACDGLFIGISGLIGAGKTTLANALSAKLNIPVFHEPVADNEYLADFYQDMGKYAFQLQVYLLNKRFKQQQQIIWDGRGGVQDRTIYEDGVFARMLFQGGFMDARDYRTYLELFQNMSNFMKRPNIIVHLDLTPEESLRRIRMRNRSCEDGISIEYLTALHAAYEAFIADISRVIPVIKVDYSKFQSDEAMAEMVKREYLQIANIRYVRFDARTPTTPAGKALADLTNLTPEKEERPKAESAVTHEVKPSSAASPPVVHSAYAVSKERCAMPCPEY